VLPLRAGHGEGGRGVVTGVAVQDRQRAMELLGRLGVSADALAVYRSLLRYPTATVDDLVVHSGLTEHQVRRAVRSLTAVRLLTVAADAGRMQPLHPSVGLSSLLDRAEQELAERHRQLEHTRQAVALISDDLVTGEGRETLRRLDTLEGVRRRLTELACQARRECLSFTLGGPQPPEALAASGPLNEAAMQRGVSIRAMYLSSMRRDRETREYAQWLVTSGGQVRTAPTLPLQLVIVDREVALLPVDPAHPEMGALETDTPGVVQAVCALFEQVWAVGEPLGGGVETEETVDGESVTDLERDLLKLLSEGHTDSTVSRKLGVSVRTVRRLMSGLMVRLTAQSRFQAGVEAVRRDWV
jgi:DNA-binding CsgD family transcriptional regulator